MKNNLEKIATIKLPTAIDSMMRKKHAQLKEQAAQKAKHYAKENCPNIENDSLIVYVEEIKFGYEQLGAEVLHQIQPAAHFPQAKMDRTHFKENETKLDKEIKQSEDDNHHDKRELMNYHPGSIPIRIFAAIGISFVIILGEIFFNAQAFQVVVANLLSGLIVSTSISVAVLIAAHMASFLYQKVKTNFERRVVVFSSLAIVTVVFLFIAYFRSLYLANHDIHISPTYFVVFNLFFFIISGLLSFFVLPTFNEMKEQYKHIKLYYAVKRRDKQIKGLEYEKNVLQREHHETEKERVQKIYLANYVIDLIKKMYWEAIGIFKGTNHFFRPDKRTPVCFTDVLPEPDIQDITIMFANTEEK